MKDIKTQLVVSFYQKNQNLKRFYKEENQDKVQE
jgi:hypothetical protein